MWLHDLIRREETTWPGEGEVDGKPVARSTNGGDSLLVGVEGQARVDLGYGLTDRAQVAWTWGQELVSRGPDVPLTRVPPLLAAVSVRYETKAGPHARLFVETGVRGATQQDRLSAEDERDVRIPEGGTPGWCIWNAGLGLSFADHVRLVARVENLLDAKYRIHGSGIYAPGTNAVLSLDMKI